MVNLNPYNHKENFYKFSDIAFNQVIKTSNFKVIREFIMNEVYQIDPNPRPATLTLFLEYNFPELLKYKEKIWLNEI